MNDECNALGHARANSNRPRRHRRAGAGLKWLAVLLVAIAALGNFTLNCVMPKSPIRQENVADRVCWYVRHRQLQADLRTLGSVAEYLVSSEPRLPRALDLTNPPAAGVVGVDRHASNAAFAGARSPG